MFGSWKGERTDWTPDSTHFFRRRSTLRVEVRFSECCLLHWGSLHVFAGGVPIFPFFEEFPRLLVLLSERAQYVREWVRIFYATLFFGDERRYIQFMFASGHWRLDRARLVEHLGVTITADSVGLHYLAYGTSEASRHAQDSIQTFLPGTPRTPYRLTPLANTIHLAMRKSLQFRQGYNEGLIALQ